jgi:hypothetical protein
MKKQGHVLSDRPNSNLIGIVRLFFSASILLAFSVAVASDQLEFKVSSASEATLEGDNVKIMVIQTGNRRFELHVPKNYGAQVNADSQSIVFTSRTGSSIITVKMSTNYAGTLPKTEELRDQVAKKYASASLVQTSICHTTCGNGLLFDLFQPAAGDLTMRIRDGFISFPEGSFELTLSCDQRDYDQSRLSFAWLLNSFHLQTEPAKQDS